MSHKKTTMTTKAKTERVKKLVENESNDVFEYIPHHFIETSETNPRKTIDSDGIQELAGSIRRVGILEPILVRKTAENKYEIIAGERRWKAAELAGLGSVPAIVKNVSDDDVLEIQIIENLQRRDVHPIDEADGYENLQNQLGWTEEEIALRVGKSVGYIANRLKLKTLNDTSRQLFEKNQLTLSHALEIGKYPADAQDEILNYAFNNFGYESQTLFPLNKFIEKIQQHYLLQLKKAPFSTKSDELRPDGLACVNCPERTNANPLLFVENYSDKDCCLNRKCWELKTQTHINIQRRKIVETDLKITEPEKIEKKAAKVPLITGNWYVRDHEKPASGDKCFHSEEYKELKKRGECTSAERAVFFNGDRIGQSAWICKNQKCETHWRQTQNIANPTHNSGEALKIRKEEIFNAKVAESTRRRVLKRIAEKFDAKNTIYNHSNSDGWQMELLTRLWQLQCSYSDHTAKVIVEVLGLEKDELSVSRWGVDFREQIIGLSADVRSKLFFLLLIADKCEIFEAYWSYKSQLEIKDLADDFAVDYRLLDAEERLNIIPNKFKDEFRAYLQEVEAGNRDKTPPHAYSSKFKAED